MSKIQEILLSGEQPTQFVKEQSRQNGKAKSIPFDPYQYEYHGYNGSDKKPVSQCKKCGTDVIWIKRVLHRVFYQAWDLHGFDLHPDGIWSNLDAVILLRRHYKNIGMRDIMPIHPKQEPTLLIENGVCVSCRKFSAEQGSLF